MRIGSRLGMACVLVLAACGGDDDADDGGKSKRETLAEALTRGVKFDGGVVKLGALPKPDAGGERVSLVPDIARLLIEPGGASLMPMSVDNPDQEEHPLESTLLQFEDSDSHIEIPIGSHGNSSAGDPTSVEIEHPFEVESDICDQLCNRRFTTRASISVVLEDGSVSVRASLVIELDCRGGGDEAACTGDEVDDEPDAAGPDIVNLGDGGELSDGGGVDAGGADGGADGGLDASAPSDAGSTGDAGPAEPPPQIGLLDPLTTPANTAVTVTISGSGFVDGAAAYRDGEELATRFVSENQITAVVPAALTTYAGNLALYVENVPGDGRTRSNILYLQVTPAPGAPLVYDYSPDNGVPGDKILIIASNLAGQALEIEDADGNALPPGNLGTISWPTAGTVDTVEVELPSSIASGPITVRNPLGSFQGKIFSVGSNLTRLTGTVIDVSTEYNTAQWSRVSGADNLLATSFFTAHGDCATVTSCTTTPWFLITFPSDQTVARIAFRGNREYASGYDFIRGRFEVLDADDMVLWDGDYDLPSPDRDLDIQLPAPVQDARKVRFSSLADESDEPGFSEFEVFGP